MNATAPPAPQTFASGEELYAVIHRTPGAGPPGRLPLLKLKPQLKKTLGEAEDHLLALRARADKCTQAAVRLEIQALQDKAEGGDPKPADVRRYAEIVGDQERFRLARREERRVWKSAARHYFADTAAPALAEALEQIEAEASAALQEDIAGAESESELLGIPLEASSRQRSLGRLLVNIRTDLRSLANGHGSNLPSAILGRYVVAPVV